MTSARVIDVSSWQHPQGAPIEWDDVLASGVLGVIIKFTQGITYLNPYAHDDYEAAHEAGLMVGAYHFCLPGTNDPEAEAGYFMAATTGLVLELGRWADIEEWSNILGMELSTWGETFCGAIDLPGTPAGLYTNRNGLASLVSSPWGYRLWEAPGGEPPRPDAWMVQTGSGGVPGIEGATDLDTVLNIRGLNPPDGGGGVLPVPTPETPSDEEHDEMTVSAVIDPTTGKARVFASDHDGDLIERTEQPDGTWLWENRDAQSTNGTPPSISADPVGTHPDGSPVATA